MIQNMSPDSNLVEKSLSDILSHDILHKKIAWVDNVTGNLIGVETKTFSH